MNVLEKFERLMALMEASGEEDPETTRDDSGEPERAKSWGKATTYSDEQPAAQGKEKNKGGQSAPASKYASALQNFGGDVARTGKGGVSKVASSSVDKVNELLKIIGEFIDSFGQLSLSKKAKGGGPSGEGGSYLDKHRQQMRKAADKDAGIKQEPVQNIDKHAQNKADVIYRELNSMMDPSTDPQRRKSAMNMIVQYVQGIPTARKVWKKDWIEDQARSATESKMKEADAKFFDKNPGQKFKGMSRNQFASRLAGIMKVAAADQFLKAFPNWEGDEEYNNKSEMAWRSIAAIQKFLSTMNQEGKQFQYIPGAFGKPPRVIEVDSEEWGVYQHNKAARKAGKKDGGEDVVSTKPGVRAGGQGSVGGSTGGKKPSAAPKEPKLSDADFAKMLDAEFESVRRAWDGMLSEAIVLAAADRTPQWWDEV